jgi:exonuclease SbcD
MGIFQQYYPRTIKIDYENSHTREIEQVDISGIVENKSFTELIGEFYYKLYGCEIGDEEMNILRDVAKEAGVRIDEAN